MIRVLLHLEPQELAAGPAMWSDFMYVLIYLFSPLGPAPAASIARQVQQRYQEEPLRTVQSLFQYLLAPGESNNNTSFFSQPSPPQVLVRACHLVMAVSFVFTGVSPVNVGWKSRHCWDKAVTGMVGGHQIPGAFSTLGTREILAETEPGADFFLLGRARLPGGLRFVSGAQSPWRLPCLPPHKHTQWWSAKYSIMCPVFVHLPGRINTAI